MITLNVKDITESSLAVSAADGEIVYSKLVEAFEKDEKVVVDFKDIELTITAFLNASIGKLYGRFSTEEIREKLSIENLQVEEKQLLKMVIDLAKRRFEKKYPDNLNNIDLLNED